MFEDSLVESSGKLAARHPFATVVSFAGQIIALSALLLLSLLYTETLPTQRWINVLQAPPPPPSAPASRSVAIASNRSGALSDPLVVPSEIPKSIGMVRTERTAPGTPPSGIAGDILGSVPENSIGIVNSLLRPATPVLPRLAPQKVRVSSGVAEGMLIHQVKPPYPVAAKMARVEECCLASRHWQGRQHPKPARDQRPSAADFSRAGGGEAMAIQTLLSKWGTSRGGNANSRQLPVNTRLALR